MPSVEPGSAVQERLRDTYEFTTRLDKELEFLTWELRPAALDDLGLVATLGNFISEWSKNYGIRAEFHSRGIEHDRLGYELETNLYRIAQEALNNVYKHAHASRVGVMLERRPDAVVLIVEDNGQGFAGDVDRASEDGPDSDLGFIGMRERAALLGGRLELETAPGKGTTLIVQLPFPLPF